MTASGPRGADETLYAFLHALADAAGEAVIPHFRAGGAVEHKGAPSDPLDPVTAADRASEAAMRRLIEATYPDDGILGEEFDARPSASGRIWVLDPIDGTRAFITGLPVWGTLIGLLEGGRARLGMMSQPFTGERFVGEPVRAWYRGRDGERVLRTRPCRSLEEAVLFTTSPALFSLREREVYERVETLVRLVRYGCDCYAYCMVAAGHADLVIEAGLKPYDIVALVPVIEGAGGIVTTWDGGRPEGGGRIVASGDARVHEAALKVLSEID